MISQGRAQVRETAKKPKTYQTYAFPAPTLGWIANGNLSLPNPGGASMLENWFPTATGAVVRRGSDLYATLGLGDKPVRSLFTYANGNNRKFFGATDDAVYNITTILTPFNWSLATDDEDTVVTDTGDTFGANSTIGLEVATGQTSGDWSVVQFSTAGGTFLRGVNGADTPFVFDGTTWGTAPTITGVTAANLKYVWAFKNRLFFIEKESLNAWYLPVDSIGGIATKFAMGGVFSLGGSLMFGASWSRDAGNGLNAMCIFITTEGEVAVYQGSDPGAAATWSLVGVYRIGKPLGPKAFIPAGGDLVIATDIGFVPLSQALQKDYAALSPSAVSAPIETEWNSAVLLRSSVNWHCVVWTEGQMVVVALPTVNEQPARMFIANSRTGAWAPFTNWDGTCLAVFQKRLFFGSQNGRVVEANVTGMDEGKPFTATYVPLFDQMNTPGLKVASMARATMRTASPVRDKISMQLDYNLKLPTAPEAAPIPVNSVWGGAIWGTSVWGTDTSLSTQSHWRSVNGNGDAHAPALQITSGSIVPLSTEVIRMDVAFSLGDFVT